MYQIVIIGPEPDFSVLSPQLRVNQANFPLEHTMRSFVTLSRVTSDISLEIDSSPQLSLNRRNMVEIGQVVECNHAFIHQKANECMILTDEIRHKLEQNDWFGTEVMGHAKDLERAAAGDKCVIEALQLELDKVLQENRYVAEEFGKACEHMLIVRRDITVSL